MHMCIHSDVVTPDHECSCAFGQDHSYPGPHPKGDLLTAPGMDEHITE